MSPVVCLISCLDYFNLRRCRRGATLQLCFVLIFENVRQHLSGFGLATMQPEIMLDVERYKGFVNKSVGSY